MSLISKYSRMRRRNAAALRRLGYGKLSLFACLAGFFAAALRHATNELGVTKTVAITIASVILFICICAVHMWLSRDWPGRQDERAARMRRLRRLNYRRLIVSVLLAFGAVVIARAGTEKLGNGFWIGCFILIFGFSALDSRRARDWRGRRGHGPV
jgi:hypothetical protein